MATFKRVGFGQVEPNHLSAQRTAQIYAQLPAASDIKVLENGQFVKYDYANGECNFSGAGEWMMVFNEVKLYDDFWRESYKDFAMIEENYTEGGIVSHPGLGIGGPSFEGRMVPRVIKINVGDHWTTNCLFEANTDGKAVIEKKDVVFEELQGKFMAPNKDTGYLELVDDANGDFVLQVVKVYTMADGQQAVKVMRVK
jgi:hypothetical protein